ncbi:MAG: hypothetical protein WC854_08095 [Bacteroidales bacterium]
MTVDDEFLELLSKEGGKAHVHLVAHKMNISFDYARSVLNSLGRRDLIDYFSDEVAVLTDKGKERLAKEVFVKKRERLIQDEEARNIWHNKREKRDGSPSL